MYRTRLTRSVLSAIRCMAGRHMSSRTKRWISSIPALHRVVGLVYHPWFNGLEVDGTSLPCASLTGPVGELLGLMDLPAPILFLARGHSGTTPLARILARAGVYIGNGQDQNALNRTLDALYWVFGFQRTLIPKLFEPGVGCLIDERVVTAAALECLRHHLSSYSDGPWGFKTCAGMFCHSLYQYVFPQAKYIYLIRDGRDVILSGNGFFHLTCPFTRQQHWEYYKLITFGISDDVHLCPFEFPERPYGNDEVMRNRFWIQAKSWREHVRMVEHLRKTGQLSPDVYTVRYEELCRDPIPNLEQLFCFLEIELTSKVKELAMLSLHARSIGRWKQYERYVSDCAEDMEAVFASMEPELELLGYRQ